MKRELEEIEQNFPKEITALKQRITDAKNQTADYEAKTKALAEELRVLKEKQGATNKA